MCTQKEKSWFNLTVIATISSCWAQDDDTFTALERNQKGNSLCVKSSRFHASHTAGNTVLVETKRAKQVQSITTTWWYFSGAPWQHSLYSSSWILGSLLFKQANHSSDGSGKRCSQHFACTRFPGKRQWICRKDTDTQKNTQENTIFHKNVYAA